MISNSCFRGFGSIAGMKIQGLNPDYQHIPVFTLKQAMLMPNLMERG